MCLINFSSSFDFVRMFPDGNKNNNDQVEKIYVFLGNNTKSWKTLGPSSVNTFSSKLSSGRPTQQKSRNTLFRTEEEEGEGGKSLQGSRSLTSTCPSVGLTHVALMQTTVR